MVIHKADALSVIRENDADSRAKLVKVVDEAIREDYVPGRSVTISIEVFERTLGEMVSPRLMNELEEIYRAAGWNARYVSDQRDGDFFQLS